MSAYDDLIAIDRAIQYWPLDESSGLVAANRADRAHDGTYPGDASLTVGGATLYGAPAALFNDTYLTAFTGNGPGVVVTNPGTLPVGFGAMSVEAWVNPACPAVASSHYAAFLGLGNITGAPNFLCDLRVLATPAGSPPQVAFAPQIAEVVSPGVYAGHVMPAAFACDGGWAAGTWAHLVLVWDNADLGSFRVYRNGALWSTGGFTTQAFTVQSGHFAAAWLGGTTQSEGETWVGGLGRVALYDYALSACQAQSHYDLMTTGHYTGCREFVRLGHASGRGYWQTSGEVIEEHVADKLARTHDGTISTVYSGAVAVLQTPLAVLTVSPPQLVGKDPATNLPAYCPPPPVVAIAPTPPATPPTTVDPNEFRCNIAHYVAGEMELAYGYAVAKINTMNSAQWGLIAAAGPLAGIILALLNVAFPPLMIVTGFGVALLALLGNDAQTAALLPLGGPAVEAMAKALYCALVPDSAGQYQITGTTLFNWSYNLTTFGADFSGNQLAEVRLLITVYQPAYWAQLAIQAGASGSTLCGGYSCSGLLP